MADRLRLSTKHRRVLETLLREHLPDVEVWAYGSRVNGRSHDGSDLDLVLIGLGLKEIPTSRLGDFEEAVRESAIPFLVEARDWARLPERFHREIERNYVVLVSSSPEKGNAHWQELKLSDAIHLVSGGTPKRSHSEYWNGLIPWLSVKDFNNDERHVESAEESITELGLVNSSTKILKEGQLIISSRGTVGALAQLSKPMAFNQSCYGIGAKSEYTTNDFLYYLIKHSIVDIKQVTHGAVFDTVTRETFEHIRINLPPLPEQSTIAYILGTLDDKIELNRRMNGTLEAMARALFKSWFVDFDPVHAKAVLRNHTANLPIPLGSVWSVERARVYLDRMDPAIADLFPDGFVGSEMGEIPEGWDASSLGDIAVSRRWVASPAILDAQTPYIGLEHMPRHSIALTDWGNTGKVISNKSIFERGDVLFGKLRPYFHKVGIAPVSGACSTDIVVISPKSAEWSSFMLGCVSSTEFVTYTNQASTGTKMPRTSWKIMCSYRLCLPNNPLVRAFQNATQSMLEHIVSNIHESHALASLRDTLLPMLISGKLRIDAGMYKNSLRNGDAG